MRMLAWLLLVLALRAAHADDAVPGSDDGLQGGDDRMGGMAVRARLRWKEHDGPLLHLDGLPTVHAAASATPARATQVLELGHGVRIATQGTWWTVDPTAPLSGLDGLTRGWSAASELSYDVGGFRFGAYAGAGQVDGRFERGSYRWAGLSARRTFRLSRWMLAWISLGLVAQQWSGTPPPGEANGTTLKLSIGTTFR